MNFRALKKSLLALAFACLFAGCREKDSTIIIWTDRPEFASYAELFNSTHDDVKAVVVYKENPAASLPPQKDEVQPDLIVGPWLKTPNAKKYYAPLDKIFSEEGLDSSIFYPQLLEYGIVDEKLYYLPVSYNLPAMVCLKSNEDLLPDQHVLTLDAIKECAAEFNSTDKYGDFSTIGFAPSWDYDFVYEASKILGAGYEETDDGFKWKDYGLNATVEYMRKWTEEVNQSTMLEQNFMFNYLYMPKYRWVSTEKCLLAFMTSDELFSLSNELSQDFTFRWLITDAEKFPVEDAIVTMGKYKKSRNKKLADQFIYWFNSLDTQQALIERSEKMNLDSKSFGIAGGFSCLKEVNISVFPSHYRVLMENLPTEENMDFGALLPNRWDSIKKQVFIPYYSERCDTGLDEEAYTPLEELIANYNRTAW
ncbi:MAG: carbohydrate ABC transporter substrate-binding protein [Treponema sp.]|nr:carbohydrate ABC transporter substrate-binding protein [Treponema sp.]